MQGVALQHVDESAGVVVVAGPALERQALVKKDVDTGDVVGVQDRLQDPVGEAQPEDVEHGGQAEVVVHTVDLVLGHQLGGELVECLGARGVAAERLLQHQAGGRGQSDPGERPAGLLGDRGR